MGPGVKNAAAVLMQEAEALRAQGALAEARRSCEEILRRSPEDAAALNLMAVIAADEGAEATALDWARKSLHADARQAKVHNNLGCVLQMRGRLE